MLVHSMHVMSDTTEGILVDFFKDKYVLSNVNSVSSIHQCLFIICMHIAMYVPLIKHSMTFSAVDFIPILLSAVIN